jgi:hypothetical protein
MGSGWANQFGSCPKIAASLRLGLLASFVKCRRWMLPQDSGLSEKLVEMEISTTSMPAMIVPGIPSPAYSL